MNVGLSAFDRALAAADVAAIPLAQPGVRHRGAPGRAYAVTKAMRQYLKDPPRVSGKRPPGNVCPPRTAGLDPPAVRGRPEEHDRVRRREDPLRLRPLRPGVDRGQRRREGCGGRGEAPDNEGRDVRSVAPVGCEISDLVVYIYGHCGRAWTVANVGVRAGGGRGEAPDNEGRDVRSVAPVGCEISDLRRLHLRPLRPGVDRGQRRREGCGGRGEAPDNEGRDVRSVAPVGCEISDLVVYISGFTQDARRVGGILAEHLWALDRRREVGAGHARVVYKPWNDSWDGFAAYAQLLLGRRGRVYIVAYSWGVGFGAAQLTEQLRRRGISVPWVVYVDGVRRTRNPLLRWAALYSGPGAPRIPVPNNVGRVYRFYQRVSRPQGHELRIRNPQRTELVLDEEIPLPHAEIDDSPRWAALARGLVSEVLEPA